MRPSRVTQILGSNRVDTPSYGSPLPMRTKHGCLLLAGVPNPGGIHMFICSPFTSSHGGVYSYRSPRSSVRLGRTRQVSWMKYDWLVCR